MARASKKTKLIEFKGSTQPIVSVTLRSLESEALAEAADELFGGDAFFDGDAGVLELDQLPAETTASPDWAAIRALFSLHGLNIVGVRGAADALRESAAADGLPSLADFRRPERQAPEEPAAPPPAAGEPTPPAEPQPAAEPQIITQPVFTPTLIIDRPLRSGQQAYARGGDLVVLAAVNAGAEVIADGSIHIYAPLRGRALAGASGETGARIFTTRFEAELVSIAGVYRTFESGIPQALAGRAAQVRLAAAGDGGENPSRLDIAALKTD